MAETKKQEKTSAAVPKKPKSKKKRKLTDVHGIAHIHATVNNTIVTITDLKGNVIA
jgi:small subunit ribosomal protein S11